MALIVNVNSSSATTVNQTNVTATGGNISTSDLNATVNTAAATTSATNATVKAAATTAATNATVKAAATTATTAAKVVSSTTTVKAVTPAIVNGLTVAQLNNGISRVEAFYLKNHRLPTYVSYGTRDIPIATFEKNVATAGLKITTKSTATTTAAVKVTSTATVNGLTSAELQDGLCRAQVFYEQNGRLPSYVSYGTTKIPIATFENDLATDGMKINTSLRPVYITSDNINNVATDTARVDAIVKGLEALGLYAVNFGLGPNTHDLVLENTSIPKNALIVDIYGGADAGVINEMASSWYKSIKAARTVYSIYWPTSEDITGLAWLPRAHDDNYDPASFTGIADPAEFLLKNGYQYLYSGSIATIINSIFKMDT